MFDDVDGNSELLEHTQYCELELERKSWRCGAYVLTNSVRGRLAPGRRGVFIGPFIVELGALVDVHH
jgi:hypothetical protein